MGAQAGRPFAAAAPTAGATVKPSATATVTTLGLQGFGLPVTAIEGEHQLRARALPQDARRLLVDELGLEPSRRLRDLEQAILRQDPSLELDRPVHAAPEAAHDDRRVSGRRRGGVFVGREDELAALLRALEDALAGRGRLLVIGGEPGIGKSRLAEELAGAAVETGAAVLWGRCWEAGGAPPYWPWVQAIRSYAREADAARLRSDLGAGAAEIADVVAEVREQVTDLPPSPPIDDPQTARFRLFDAIAAFLKRVAGTKPLVMVLDDLHWADEGSLRLLEFVSRELAEAPHAADRHLPGRRTLTSAPTLPDAGRADPRAPLRAHRPAWAEP